METKNCGTGGLKYLRIAELLERDILAGRFQPGEQLPGERELAIRFGVANLTLRQALRVLSGKRLVRSHHGKGNFIGEARICRDYLEKKKRILNQKNILLFGMHTTNALDFNPVNLSAVLMRYRGIVETAFLFDIPVQTLDHIHLEHDGHNFITECRQAAGVIIIDNGVSEELISRCRDAGLPTVVISTGNVEERGCMIRVDAGSGIRTAVEYLIREGHTRIGYTGGGPNTFSNRSRYQGYRESLEKAGLCVDPELVVHDSRGFPEEGEAACSQLMSLPEPPTAIVAASDYRAIGVLHRALEMGIRVPEKLRIIGYDDIPEAAIQKPALSTIHNPLYETGEEAVRMICRKMEAPEIQDEIKILNTELMIRET